MTAQDAMKRLVNDELRATFKAHGFRAKGLTFYRALADNFAIVQLQKSRQSTASAVEFTINLGVFSGRVQRTLSKFTWMPEVAGVPTEPACHLRQRVGFLMPDAKDVWWSIHDHSDVGDTGAAIRSVLQVHAFPFLEARVSDEGLRDHWRRRSVRGAEGLALAVLVRDLGPRDALAPLLEQLRADTPPKATGLAATIARFAATCTET